MSSLGDLKQPTNIPSDKNFDRLFEETIFKRDQFQDPTSIIGVDYNSYQADAIQSLMLQVDYAGCSNRLSKLCSQDLHQQLLDDYCAKVDDQNGLNNYAEEVLELCKHRKNESASWKSSLSELSEKDLLSRYCPLAKPKTAWEPTPEYEANVLDAIEKSNVLTTSLTTDKTKPTSTVAFRNQAPLPVNTKKFNNYNEQLLSKANYPSKPVVGTSYKRKNDNYDNAKELEENMEGCLNSFKTAKDVWIVEQQKKTGNSGQISNCLDYGTGRKTLGTRPSGLNRKFIPPVSKNSHTDNNVSASKNGTQDNVTSSFVFQKGDKVYEFDPEKVKNVDSKMLEVMINEIMDDSPTVSWEDIAGLEFAKKTIQEIVIWPLLRPDIFKGLRGPPKGILLFGPPGTGKTLIGKCIASQSKSTFFSISASSLTSKWIGDGEKLVRALFVVARILQPSVVFIDEIDSLLSQRSDQEHESSRRLKTEFLVQLDGAATSSDDRVLIVGATNRPQELDEAARRRLVKRLYIPLPEAEARRTIVGSLLEQFPHSLKQQDLNVICDRTDGYSGADMANLCKEAALGPVREINFEDIERIPSDQLRPINLKDFLSALSQVRASVSKTDLQNYLEWNASFGSSYSTVC